MPANRDPKTGKWNAQFYYTDWTGKKVKKMKRGFATKKEAQDWERHFKLEKASSLDMTFGDFYRRYEQDVKPKVRENTWIFRSCSAPFPENESTYFRFFRAGVSNT